MLSTLTHSSASSFFGDFQNEAANISKREPLLSVMLDDAIIHAASFSESIAHLLSLNFAGLIPMQSWYRVLLPIFEGSMGKYGNDDVISMMVDDLKAIKERDPACVNLVHAFVHFKGFKAIQAHRAAHVLWTSQRKDLAIAVQSRASELWLVATKMLLLHTYAESH